MKPAGVLAAVFSLWALASCGAKSGLHLPEDARADAGDAGSEDAPVDPPDAADDALADVVLDVPADAPTVACTDGLPDVPWAWTAQGPESEYVSAIALDSDGSLYAVGTFAGTVDFDPGPALAQHTAVDRLDVFLTKLACNGTPLWTHRWGGLDLKGASSGWGDEGGAVAVAPDGSVLVGGQYCSSVDFDPGPGEDVRTSQSCFDGFVVSLDASGNYAWGASFGGSGRDRVGGLAVAGDGSIYAAGQFEGVVDFDPGPGQALGTSVGELDEFVVKLTAEGELSWVMTWGGPATEYGTGHVAVTSTGAVVVAGQFAGQVDFDPGPATDVRTSAGSDDAFAIAFAPSGQRLWARTWGGTSYDDVRAVTLAPDDSVYVTGAFYGAADFNPGPGLDLRDNVGLYDAYLLRLGADGSYLWTRTWGAVPSAPGSQHMVSGLALAAAADGRVLVSGSFQGQIDFEPSPGQDAVSSSTLDAYDAFVSAFSASGDAGARWTFGSDGLDGAYAIAAHGTRSIGAGSFSGLIELSPKPFPGGLSRSPVGKQDAFVVHW